MPLDPQAVTFLEGWNSTPMGAGFNTLTPTEIRAFIALAPKLEGEPIAKTEDRTVPGPYGDIPVRVYTPDGPAPKPGLVYYHGGGWVIGSVEGSDNNCRALANASGCVVVSVDYRLSPEYKFPIPFEECFVATQWVAANAAELGIDPAKIAVGGDSAGGNLAAAVSIHARDAGGPAIAFQMLIYPVTDLSFDTPSYTENADGYLLTTESMRWFWGHYLAEGTDPADPRISPLRAELEGLPPAIVITAEFDPLRDEGEAFAAKLKAAGVPVEVSRYDGMIHGFYGNPVLDKGRVAVDHTARALRAALA